MTKRIAILVSGSGTNAQAIIDKCRSGDIKGEVVAVISNRPDAFALERAKKANIEAITINHKEFAGRHEFDLCLAETLNQLSVDLVVLAGFMRILTPEFVSKFTGKMLNIHPSLLPKYPGLNTHQRAIDAQDLHHGASVHFVIPELDAGPIVIQSIVPIKASDNAESLATRVASTEWAIYPTAVAWFCENRLRLVNGDVTLDGKVLGDNEKQYEFNIGSTANP